MCNEAEICIIMFKNMLFGHIFYFFMSTLANFNHLDVKTVQIFTVPENINMKHFGFVKKYHKILIYWYIFTSLHHNFFYFVNKLLVENEIQRFDIVNRNVVDSSSSLSI